MESTPENETHSLEVDFFKAGPLYNSPLLVVQVTCLLSYEEFFNCYLYKSSSCVSVERERPGTGCPNWA